MRMLYIQYSHLCGRMRKELLLYSTHIDWYTRRHVFPEI